MANQDGPSAVNFQSEKGNVDFEQETGQSGGITEKLSEAAQGVNWNKVAVGAGAAAAVAGAAYAAKKFVGGRGEDESGSSGGRGSKG